MSNACPPLLAFGFGNLLMLGWLGAAAAPILIHLWSKRRYREVPWAAMEYLLAALRHNARRMRLEQWLLLAVRTLIVALIVLAVAQPFLEQAGFTLVRGQRTLKVLVIDGSYSMAYQPTDKNRFERAKQVATQIVDESAPGDAFLLVLMTSPPSVIVGTPAAEPGDFLEELANLKLPHGGADLAQTVALVEQLLAQAEPAGLRRSEVYFLTDLGRNSWVPELKDSQASEYRQRLERLARATNLLIVDLGQSNAENVAVTQLGASEPFVTTAREATFAGQLRNFGAQDRTRHVVQWYVDGRRVKDSQIDLPPGERANVSLTHRFDSPGDHVVELRASPDLLAIDDHRWYSVEVRDHLRVLCVNGKPAVGGFTGAADYVALALDPGGGEAASASVVRPEVIAESGLVERDLARYDCVFLCNVAQFTAHEARALEGVLKRGGGLVFFLGDQVLAERYNRELTGPPGVHVLPATLGAVVSEAQYHFDPLNYRHPIVRVFQGREQAGLLSTPVYKYFRLVPEPLARVALAFDGGDPAIVEQKIQQGTSILVATEGSLSSVDPVSKNPWTNLPAWPSFVPLVQEMLAAAVQTRLAQHNLDVGQAVEDLVDAASAGASVNVATPGGAQETVRMAVDPEGGRYQFADTHESGVYRVDLGPPANRQQSFAVNVDTSESDLTRATPDELPKEFVLQGSSSLDDPAAAALGARGDLHKLLLYVVLGLLLFETFLAWRFGYSHR